MAEHDEPPPAVGMLELFYDLVFVVAIHDAAAGLETEAPLWPHPALTFLLRMFLIWSVWHRSAGWANMASQIHRRVLRAYHYAFVLLLMACMSFMARAIKADDNRTLLILYGATLWLILVMFSVETVMASGKQREFLRLLMKMSIPGVVLESALVGVAAYHANEDGESETSLSWQCLVSWAAVAAIFLGLRTLSSVVFACSDPAKLPAVVFDEAHFDERYGLIMLIVLGEVVAAGGVAGSAAAIGLPLSAVATAFLCFLLAFVATPAARRSPWACGTTSQIHAPHAYLGMACALAALGPAFARIIEEAEQAEHANPSHERRGEEGEEHGSGGGEADQGCASCALLYVSVGAFLLATAAVHVLGEDRAPARCSVRVRAGALVALGVLVGLLASIPATEYACNASLASALVPSVLALLTLFEFWASSSVGGQQAHLQEQEPVAASSSNPTALVPRVDEGPAM